MRSLGSQVFNNMFIERLASIESKFRKGARIEAGVLTGALVENFLVDNWVPFPDFRNIKIWSNVAQEIWEFAGNLINLEVPNAICESSLENLKKLAQVFNFIDCTFHFKPREAQQFNEKNQFINILCSSGLFTKVEKIQDCHGISRVINAPKTRPEALPSKHYEKLMEVLNSLESPDLIKNFLATLFDDMNPIEKNSAKMEKIKTGIEDIFLLGQIESVVEMSNFYKEKFQEMVQEVSDAKELEDDDESETFGP